VADFACREKMLVVEVDGATHGSEEEVAHDAVRSRFLEAQGWRVVRVWNEDVVHGIDRVMETILQLCDSR
jgi:very-short-patch-repair endonuclease